MDNKQKTLEELSHKSGAVSQKNAIVGFDGFIDIVVTPVMTRSGKGDNFVPFPSLADFGQRIVDAAGRSANIELYPKLEKLGGNGPIMANAMSSSGSNVRYIGALGFPDIAPVFADFAKRSQAISLAQPGVTHAVECDDGKVMLGKTAPLDELTFDRILEVVGEGVFHDMINRADVFAAVNWTMIPNMTDIFTGLLERVLPNIGPKEEGRLFFFDLTDPAKRPEGDLRHVLTVLPRFRSHGQVTLGLNFAEALQVSKVLGHGSFENTPDELKRAATRIRQTLDITCVVIHPIDGAACATRDDAWHVVGPYTAKPKITTGAGDHFNAGFATAQMLGLSPLACLTVAVSFSGYYVRTAQSPSLSDVDSFIRNWK